MKRVLRWVYAGVGWLSLLLLLATVALWIRSYLTVDLVAFAADRCYRTISAGGAIYFESMTLNHCEYNGPVAGIWPRSKMTSTPHAYRAWVLTTNPKAGRWEWHRTGYTGQASLMGWAGGNVPTTTLPQRAKVELVLAQDITNGVPIIVHEERISGPRYWIPFWLIAAVLAIVPAMRARGVLARFRQSSRRRRRGLCTACGYDLRPSPEICPECGAAVPAVRVAAAATSLNRHDDCSGELDT